MDTKRIKNHHLILMMIMRVDKIVHRSEYTTISTTGKRENVMHLSVDVVEGLVHAMVPVGLTMTLTLSYQYQTNSQAPQRIHQNASKRIQNMTKVRADKSEHHLGAQSFLLIYYYSITRH